MGLCEVGRQSPYYATLYWKSGHVRRSSHNSKWGVCRCIVQVQLANTLSRNLYRLAHLEPVHLCSKLLGMFNRREAVTRKFCRVRNPFENDVLIVFTHGTLTTGLGNVRAASFLRCSHEPALYFMRDAKRTVPLTKACACTSRPVNETVLVLTVGEHGDVTVTF